jgi:hypothetical protein
MRLAKQFPQENVKVAKVEVGGGIASIAADGKGESVCRTREKPMPDGASASFGNDSRSSAGKDVNFRSNLVFTSLQGGVVVVMHHRRWLLVVRLVPCSLRMWGNFKLATFGNFATASGWRRFCRFQSANPQPIIFPPFHLESLYGTVYPGED